MSDKDRAKWRRSAAKNAQRRKLYCREFSRRFLAVRDAIRLHYGCLNPGCCWRGECTVVCSNCHGCFTHSGSLCEMPTCSLEVFRAVCKKLGIATGGQDA